MWDLETKRDYTKEDYEEICGEEESPWVSYLITVAFLLAIVYRVIKDVF